MGADTLLLFHAVKLNLSSDWIKYAEIYNERKLSTMKIERFHTYEDELDKQDDDKYNYHLRLPLSPDEHEAIERVKRNNDSPPEIKLAAMQPDKVFRLRLSNGEVVYVGQWGANSRFTVTQSTRENVYSNQFITGSDEKLPDGYDAEVIRFIRSHPSIDLGINMEEDTSPKVYEKNIKGKDAVFKIQVFRNGTMELSCVSVPQGRMQQDELIIQLKEQKASDEIISWVERVADQFSEITGRGK